MKARRQNNIRDGDAHGEPLPLKPLPLTLARMSQVGLCAYFNNKRDERSIRFVCNTKKRSWREVGTKGWLCRGEGKSHRYVRYWPKADIPYVRI